MSEWESKCCKAEVYEKKTGYAYPFAFYYCSKCHKECGVEDKRRSKCCGAKILPAGIPNSDEFPTMFCSKCHKSCEAEIKEKEVMKNG